MTFEEQKKSVAAKVAGHDEEDLSARPWKEQQQGASKVTCA